MAVTMVIGNRPEIAASLFAPAHTMAAVLANEFAEADGAVYLSALIEVALVLFGITMLVNAVARLLIAATTSQRAPRCGRDSRTIGAAGVDRARHVRRDHRSRRRMTVGILLFLLALPRLPGRLVAVARASSRTCRRRSARPGGGMANALVGSAQAAFVAALVGVPVGFIGGVYLAEFGRGRLAFLVRYAADVLNGVPSIVDRRRRSTGSSSIPMGPLLDPRRRPRASASS